MDDLAAAKGKVDLAPSFVLSDPTGAITGGRVTLNPNGKEVIGRHASGFTNRWQPR